MATKLKRMPAPAPKSEPRSVIDDIYDVVELVMICAAVIILLYTFAFRMTVVNQHSMEETLIEGDYTIVSDLFYTPKTGDIVVVQNTALDSHTEPLVKRVIAVGGDTVNINYSNWKVTLTHNGESRVLDESEDIYLYLPTGHSPLTSDWCTKPEKDGSHTYEVPEGYLLVMGDNRNVSADSRLASIGFVPESCVVGRLLLRILPFEKFGTVR